MNTIDAISTVFKILFSIWNYIRGDEAIKAEATLALANQFKLIETKSGPIMSDILVRMGRSSWVDWKTIVPPVIEGKNTDV